MYRRSLACVIRFVAKNMPNPPLTIDHHVDPPQHGDRPSLEQHFPGEAIKMEEETKKSPSEMQEHLDEGYQGPDTGEFYDYLTDTGW